MARLLRGVFESSPYLSALIAPRCWHGCNSILTGVPEELFRSMRRRSCTLTMAEVSDDRCRQAVLRTYKNDVALLTALADLGGVWPVMTVTRALSECCRRGDRLPPSRYLFRMASTRGHWQPLDAAHPEKGSGYFVLAMGKHGAFELNYSSDIDLIVFFDRARARARR